MGEQANQIEERIRQQRSELGQNISELQQKVKDTVDWRAQFDHRPMTMIGLAIAGGFLLSSVWRSKRRPRNYNRTTDGRTWVAENHSPATSYNSTTNTAANRSSSKTSESVRDIKAALVGVAAARIGDVIETVLPGFNEEYDRVKNGDRQVGGS